MDEPESAASAQTVEVMPLVSSLSGHSSGPQVADIELEGTEFGRYVVGRRLGAGGGGAVYRALDPELDRPVALKLLQARHRSADGAPERRLLREARSLAQLSHPAVVSVYDVGRYVFDESGIRSVSASSDDPSAGVFLVMELVEGQTLRAWIAGEKSRPWREVVRVFIAAGRGLQAAHEAGLVHRDFKPSNVILDGAGQPRILDFGLAREQGEARRPQDDESVLESSTAEQHVTRHGSIVGTPGYMAPEQQSGEDVDARADQYSFCVSLYEALAGVRPGNEPDHNHGSRDSARPERLTALPPGLIRALDRGLDNDPQDRFEDMEVLLAQLRAAVDPPSRWPWLAGAVAVATAAGMFMLSDEQPPLCHDSESKWSETWNPGRAEELRAELVGTKVAYAQQAYTGLRSGLDGYGSRWISARARACEVLGDDARARDIALACLDEQRRTVERLLEVVGDHQRQTVEHLAAATAELRPPSACLRAQSFDEVTAPALARQAAELRQQLAYATALHAAGQWSAAAEASADIATAAEAAGLSKLHNEARLQYGRSLRVLGQVQDAREVLASAATDASAQRQDDVVVVASLELAQLLAQDLRRYRDAETWLQRAETAAVHVTSEQLDATLLHERGSLAKVMGDFEAAETSLRSALAIRERLFGPESSETEETLLELARTYFDAGRLKTSREFASRAVRIAEQQFGEDHPRALAARLLLSMNRVEAGEFEQAEREVRDGLARAQAAFGPRHLASLRGLEVLADILTKKGEFDEGVTVQERCYDGHRELLGEQHPTTRRALTNLAYVLGRRGDFDRARELLERAAVLVEEHDGRDSIDYAQILVALANIHSRQGRRGKSMGLSRQALEIAERALGPDHPHLAPILNNIGVDLVREERHDEAQPFHERALAIRRSHYGEEHVETATSHGNLAWALHGRRKLTAAEEHFRRAIEVFERTYGPDHFANTFHLTGLGFVLIDAGRPQEAIPVVERALKIGRKAQTKALFVHETTFTLGRAMFAAGRDRSEALGLIQQARAGYEQAGDAPALAEIDQWLRDNADQRRLSSPR